MASDVKSIMIDDDDDNEIEVDVNPEETYIKNVIKKGIQDSQQIANNLCELSEIAESFGNMEAIAEMIIYYGEVVPNILIGNYDLLLEGIDDVERDLALAAFKHTRKQIFNNLSEKYSE